jgi:hypothetical protein
MMSYDLKCGKMGDSIDDVLKKVTLKLSKKHYKTAWVLAHLLGFDSLDDYVRYKR